MDKVIENLELQLQLAFLTDSTIIHISRDEGLFVFERLKEIREKWYESNNESEVKESEVEE